LATIRGKLWLSRQQQQKENVKKNENKGKINNKKYVALHFSIC